MIRFLFLGDIFGRSGREIVKAELPSLKEEFKADFCIANCENIASGRGITEKTVKELFEAGIDAFTGGNHLWDKKDAIPYLSKEKRIVKPLNYPEAAIGSPWCILEKNSVEKLAIVCLTGQVFMQPCDSPFTIIDKYLPQIQKETRAILVDFHAEATGEKRSFGFHLDGKVSAVLGTHTHIQTADEELLPAGSAYITDVGMNGAHDSIIGVKKELILQKTLTGMPVRFEPASTGNQINAVMVEIDPETGKANDIIRIKRKLD
ncbi:MAG: TIGR00282 family metallophosphoesterase [Candidatus Stygibacter australis]|nr:TIGR00282 family metallophosphoesterase [Candidatus Stygibacter australis]MDP8321599.1 TIGR00282 family metallophosphoesterase [Candidatus Stygibacter australis]